MEDDIIPAVRQQRLQALAEDTFGDAEKAGAWLRRPLTEIDGRSPLDLAETVDGQRRVETILAKIAWGAPA